MRKKPAAPIVIINPASLGRYRDQLASALASYRYEKSQALSIRISAIRAAIVAYEVACDSWSYLGDPR